MSSCARGLMRVTRRLPQNGIGEILCKILKRSVPFLEGATIPADVWGSRMYLDPSDIIGRSLMFGPQFYDRRVVSFMEQHLEPGDTFVDLGAHIGCFTLLAARLTGAGGRVIAVEAAPFNVERLQRHLEVNEIENVEIVPCGVADRDGALDFLYSLAERNTGGGSFLYPRFKELSMQVQCKKLATILNELQVGIPKMIKLDLELFEFRVLKKYLEEADAADWPRYIVVETYKDRHRIALAGGDVSLLLKEKGYLLMFSERLNSVFERA